MSSSTPPPPPQPPQPPQFTNLVLSGGGIKALSILGAIKYLESSNILKHINVFVGTSAGSILSFLLILGYTTTSILDIFRNDYLQIMYINYDNILNIFETFGINSHDNYRSLLQKYLFHITRLNDITFKQLYRITSRNLIITGSNLTDKRIEYFNKEITPDMSVIDAILISSCIPIIFYPIKYNNCYYVDGGLFNNFPINYIDPADANHTIGITLQDATYRHTNITSFTEYIDVIIDSLHYKCSYDNVPIEKFKYICYIPFDIISNNIDIETNTDFYINTGFTLMQNVFSNEII